MAAAISNVIAKQASKLDSSSFRIINPLLEQFQQRWINNSEADSYVSNHMKPDVDFTQSINPFLVKSSHSIPSQPSNLGLSGDKVPAYREDCACCRINKITGNYNFPRDRKPSPGPRINLYPTLLSRFGNNWREWRRESSTERQLERKRKAFLEKKIKTNSDHDVEMIDTPSLAAGAAAETRFIAAVAAKKAEKAAMEIDTNNASNEVDMATQEQTPMEQAGGLRLAPTCANYARHTEFDSMIFDHFIIDQQEEFAMGDLTPREEAAILRRDLSAEAALATAMNETRIDPEDAMLIDTYVTSEECNEKYYDEMLLDSTLSKRKIFGNWGWEAVGLTAGPLSNSTAANYQPVDEMAIDTNAEEGTKDTQMRELSPMKEARRRRQAAANTAAALFGREDA